MGIKTGLNDAFLIDSITRNSIIQSDRASAKAIIRPYLRGQDIDRWFPDWAELWMIALKSSGDHPWPWVNAGDEAEAIFVRHIRAFTPISSRSKMHSRSGRTRGASGGSYGRVRTGTN